MLRILKEEQLKIENLVRYLPLFICVSYKKGWG